jgi:large subunit ribosomal protein L13
MEHVIDASGQTLGRLASKVAMILQGKMGPGYAPHKSGTDRVIIKNVGKIIVSGSKQTGKIYHRHTGYMGHLYEKNYKDAFAKSPEKVMYDAIFNMLPKNFLRQKRLNRLTIEK